MSLSIIEMNYLQQGVVRPLENSLQDLVNTMAMRHSQYHKDTAKVVPVENIEATNYFNKANALCTRITNRESNVFVNLNQRAILQLGNLTEFADLRLYSISQWQSFLENNMPAIFNDVAGITPAEIIAYNSI